ncbi:ATP-binding protein [Streptomyces sp. NPDC052101]|uniref:ATP-binding protein n=1 Tax=Streptomyces sp. NPDC052101 TaxID=3155763 RepID=UPI00342A65E5
MASVIPSAPLGTDAAADRPGLGAATGAAPQGGAARRRFRFELAAHPGSVAQARRLTHARLTRWSVCADTCDSAALVISELVTNAIVHTASNRVVCELHDHDDTVRIAVRDWGCAPGEPHPSPQRPDEEHGRGLFLVDALCRAWGAQEHGPGLLVWAELARRTDAAPETPVHDTPGHETAAHDTTAYGSTAYGSTAYGIADPCNDLGWGARTKPGRPDDSDEDESPEGRHPGSGHPPHQPSDEPHPLHRPSDQQHRLRPPFEQQYRPPQLPEQQQRHWTPESHRHGTPEPHRHRAPDRPSHQPLHRAPEQRHAGERP